MRHFIQAIVTTLALATATLAFAQSTTGTITGVVRDQQGLVVPGASVELINEETGVNRSTVSLGNGAFTFAAIPQGRYTVRVTLEGFSVTENTGIQLRSNETLATGAITLGVGQFSQVTTVTADTAVVQTASSEMSSAIEASEMDALVARGRDPMGLFRVMPGVSQVSGGLDGPVSLGGVNGIGLPTVSGLQSNLGNITLDGMPANDADTNNMMSVISMDAIEEIKLIGSGFQAEHGRSAGASMTVVSKSGTNAFRGTYSGTFCVMMRSTRTASSISATTCRSRITGTTPAAARSAARSAARTPPTTNCSSFTRVKTGQRMSRALRIESPFQPRSSGRETFPRRSIRVGSGSSSAIHSRRAPAASRPAARRASTGISFRPIESTSMDRQ